MLSGCLVSPNSTILPLRGQLYSPPDNLALRFILNLADASARLARWWLRIAEYEYDVEYRPIVYHQLADEVSKFWTEGEDDTDIDYEVPYFIVESNADPERAEGDSLLDNHDNLVALWESELGDNIIIGLREVMALAEVDEPANAFRVE